MKKLIIALAVVVSLAFTIDSVFARGWGWSRCGDGYNERDRGYGPGYGRGFSNLEFMKTELGLTDKQVKQIFDIGTQYREKRFENRNNPEKLTEIRTEHRKAVEAVLTKEQAEKFNALKDKMNAFYKRGGCPYNW